MSAPDLLERVWDRADAAEPRFSADEVLSWPKGEEALLTEAGLIRRDSNTTTVICDACADGHVEEVDRFEEPPGSGLRAYIFCPDAGRVAVPLERLKQWTVDFAGLARAAARALGFTGTIKELVPTRLWSLGKMTAGSKRCEVLLARGVTWDDAPRVIGPPLDAAGETFLLVPGEIPHAETWPRRPRAAALRQLAHLDGNRLAIDRSDIEGALGRSASGGKPKLSREQIERGFDDALVKIRTEAATMAEDDPLRPRPIQEEVARKLGRSRRDVQDRVKLLNRYRVAAGEPKLGWEDIVRGRR